MWLLFIWILDSYLLFRTIKTILDIWEYFEMKKSAKTMAEIWKEEMQNEAHPENKREDEPTCNGKHSS